MIEILDPISADSAAGLDQLLLAITNVINLSLQTGYFADAWITAVVQPLLKPGLDSLFQNFRPISKFQFVSKLTKRVEGNSFLRFNLLIAPITD